MKPGRRDFLAGLLATGLIPNPTWADAGAPAYLSAAALPDGTAVLCGIDATLNLQFELPLPARGHAAAAHPTRPEAVAFARRPGRFAVVIDCITGAQRAMLNAPAGRHFYGHGAFSGDGGLLYTTENDYEAGEGRIGVWDAARGYARVDEWPSGGIGPHDIKRLPGTDMLVVANGGIDTHPDSGRTKLNLATMRPNLAYIQAGEVVERAELPPDLHRNSIRHLALGPRGDVAFGMQWQGDVPVPALVGHHKRGAPITMMRATPDQTRDMQRYVGSIAYAADGTTIAVTSPRGGVVQFFDVASARCVDSLRVADVCGLSAAPDGFTVTSGTGALARLRGSTPVASGQARLSWDNHLVQLEMA